MECPYCKCDLKYDDYYYSGRPENFYGNASNGIHYPSTMKKLGDIYKCKNYEGFEDYDEAEVYKNETNSELPIDEIVCESSSFNGFFHTNSQNNLKEGYPC